MLDKIICSTVYEEQKRYFERDQNPLALFFVFADEISIEQKRTVGFTKGVTFRGRKPAES